MEDIMLTDAQQFELNCIIADEYFSECNQEELDYQYYLDTYMLGEERYN